MSPRLSAFLFIYLASKTAQQSMMVLQSIIKSTTIQESVSLLIKSATEHFLVKNKSES